MKELRTHLENARREYRSIRYEGDLATEVLVRAHHRGPWAQRFWAAGAIGAAAAALVLAIYLTNTTSRNPVAYVEAEAPAIEPDAAIENSAAELTFSIPSLSVTLGDTQLGGIDLAPPAGLDFGNIAPPSLSLFSESTGEQQTSTTQEAV